MPRFLYTLLLYLLLPFAPIRLLWRGIRQRDYLRHWGERFGFYPKYLAAGYSVVEPSRTIRTVGDSPPRLQPQSISDTKRERPLIWLHCVSVGETRAAEPLVRELQQRYPKHAILMTHATPTGRATSEQLFGNDIQRAYLPYDLPGAARRFLNRYQPQVGLLMETELWFNLIAECKRRKMPLLLVNARLSEKSARGYAKIARLTREGLNSLTAIAAQTAADAVRLQNLGGQRVNVFGNLKFDVTPPVDAGEQGAKLREKFGVTRPVFLAASTRDGEEAMILETMAGLDVPGLLIVIVPRHPQRFDEVAGLLEKRGVKFIRRSSLKRTAVKRDIQVVLGDSMGEMFAYYAACDVAFIGGSLLPFGGQNLIEGAIMGKPLLVGPHTFNFAEIAEQAVEKGAALRIQHHGELEAAVQQLLTDTKLQEQMGQAALEFSRSASGATVKIADMVKPYLFST